MPDLPFYQEVHLINIFFLGRLSSVTVGQSGVWGLSPKSEVIKCFPDIKLPIIHLNLLLTFTF